MSSTPLYVLIQPNTKSSYWGENILQGIRRGLVKYRDTLCMIDTETPDGHSIYKKPVLLVGSDISWIDKNIDTLSACGAVPILVNACMLPVHRSKASGVVFELEEAMNYCVDYLRESGHGKTAFLGAHANSVADIAKCRAFDDVENTYTATGEVEKCIDEFLDIMPQKRYNGIICANDTVAIHLMNKMLAIGYKLPEDCYIIGMGCSFLAANHSITLSSVAFNYSHMGEQAVELYHTVSKSSSLCHYTVSIPCYFVPGKSTGETPSVAYPIVNSGKPASVPQVNRDVYFNSKNIQQIIELEAIFQQCDKTDTQIIFGMMRGESKETIAENVYLTPRAVRYRINNFFKRYNQIPQNEFLDILRQVLNQKG